MNRLLSQTQHTFEPLALAAIFEEESKFATLHEFEDATQVLETIDRHKS
jgi:hypothetical protein